MFVPLYKVINGDPHHSDHQPLIVELNEKIDLGRLRRWVEML
jgi:hypothetical protein